MSKTNNLTDYLYGLAEDIRDTIGVSELINPQNFENEIDSIPNIINRWLLDDISYVPMSYLAGITRIRDFAFYGRSALENIEIPNGVTDIGESAFSNCTSLTSIALPNGVTNIGQRGFYGCTSLENVTVPDTIIGIGSYAFNDCPNLQYNEYDNAYYLGNDINPYVVLIKAKDTSITSCIINPNTKIIYSQAFYNCRLLESITIPNTITDIGYNAFFHCESLSSVTIPDSVRTLQPRTFGDCVALVDVIFDGNSPLDSISATMFVNCTSLISITIPDSVTSIGTSAFSGCTSLTSITIPDSVTEIGTSAFYNCTSLMSIGYDGTISEWNSINKGNNWDYNTYTYIIHCTDGDFNKNGNLITPVELVYTLKEDDTYEVSGYVGMATQVVVPNFYNDKMVTSIGSYVFEQCDELTSVSFGYNVTSIREHAFYSCDMLTRIDIPNSVTRIGYESFMHCAYVSAIIIGSGVTNIEGGAFRNIPRLKSVTIMCSVPPVLSNANAFGGQTSAPIYVPANAVNDYKTATNWTLLADRIQAIPQ